MKFLITGATGLVGIEIISQLLNQGHQVNILTSSKNKKTNSLVASFYWNVNTQEIDINAFDGVEKVIHLAGAQIAKRWTKSYKLEILNSRVLSTKLLFKTLASINHQVNQVISASAIGIYPSHFSKVYSEESIEKNKSFLSEVTYQWEQEALKIEKLNISVSLIRIGIVLSNKGGAFLEFIKTIKLWIGAPLGSGNQHQSWIHIQDIAGIFIHIALHKLPGVFNGVSPFPTTNKLLQKQVANLLGKPFFLPTVPTFILKLILGEMHNIVTNSQQVSAKKILNTGFQFKFPSLQKALENLLK